MNNPIERSRAAVILTHEIAKKITEWTDYDELAIPLAKEAAFGAYQAAAAHAAAQRALTEHQWVTTAGHYATMAENAARDAQQWLAAATRLTDPDGEAAALEALAGQQ